jgi:predicted GNAT family N-acyltransferase
MANEVTVTIQPWGAARAEASRIRAAVFVVEQNVPATLELDEWDEQSEHALATASGAAVGTGRLLPDGHIGRMAVLREWRRAGVGAAILRALMSRAQARGMARVVLNAQTHAAPFYARFGFVARGDEFMEAGIPHVEMSLEL